MTADKFRQRLDVLFTDLERLAANPDDKSPLIRRELDALKARLLELEALFTESETRGSAKGAASFAHLRDVEARSTIPILYDEERAGYVYRAGILESLPASASINSNSDDVIVAPLLSSGRTIGEIQIESASQRPWSQEEANLANSVARQASLQIENLRLLAATERARVEAESASRRFVHEGWESYLDAIHQNERIGYAYDQDSVTFFDTQLQVSVDFEEAVKVMDEQVGRLYLRTDPNHPLTDEDKALVTAVASQIAQQVENIRLLADASRARADAEEATRLLTRQNWETYTQKDEGAVIGFMYDSIKVSPLGNESIPHNIAFEQPLVVRGESIGHIAVAGIQNVSPEAKDLVSAIAAQASIHLETLRLTEELQKRARELQELDRLKSAFLANMSHELRTPLNSILGFADVMLEELDGPLTENMNNDLGLIQKNGQHLLHLINDVLDMAKIESGKMNLAPEKFRVHEILEEVTSITSTLASEKNLALFIETESDQVVEIFADRTRIRQVMINIINNAIKFTEKGKISMRVTHQDEQVLIAVRDTGIGIPVNQLEAVFQEFIQVDTSSTRKAGGTGLGLPISRRLVEMHGGRLWAESAGVDGKGATFFVELPLEAKLAEPIEKTSR
jgi:signal transduction histidine kinase